MTSHVFIMTLGQCLNEYVLCCFLLHLCAQRHTGQSLFMMHREIVGSSGIDEDADKRSSSGDHGLFGTIRMYFVSSRLAVTTLPLHQAHAGREVGKEEVNHAKDNSNSRYITDLCIRIPVNGQRIL